MILEANKKISTVLKNLLEKYSLGSHPVLGLDFDSDEIGFDTDDYRESIAIDRVRELDRLLLILNGLVDKEILEKVEHKLREHHSELTITDAYIIYFPEDFNLKAIGYLKELSGEYAIFDKRKNNKLKLESRKNGLFLLGDRKIKEIRISDDNNSRQSKLFKHLFLPDIGLYKTIDSTVEAMRIGNDPFVSNGEVLIKSRFKEIQSIMSQAKAQTKFSLDWKDNSVAMITK